MILSNVNYYIIGIFTGIWIGVLAGVYLIESDSTRKLMQEYFSCQQYNTREACFNQILKYAGYKNE